MRTALRAVALLLATALVIPGATAGTVFLSFLFLPLPATMPKQIAGVTAQISHIYDIDGNEIGQFRQFETTKPVSAADIDANPYLKKAVIASEDRRFYEHAGVDPIGTIRALVADLRNRGVVEGGSTITQQYVKNAYVGNERSISRKVREAILASQLDRQLDKDQILFQYLSDIYLGEGAHGVGAAAETYFHKSVRDLTLSEAATLSGLIPAPSRYEPRGNVGLAEARRETVLSKMLKQHLISQQEFDVAAPQKLWLGAFGPPPAGQPATVVYPREQERTQYPYFVDYVRRYVEAKYGAGAEYTRGLKIYTTLDQGLQKAAEDEVAKSIAGVGNGPGDAGPLEMALVTVEPGSGYVKALVGGKDFYADGGQVNLALGKAGGGSGRQPGSSFKPFVLATALEQGVKPTKTYSGRSPTVIADHPFKNYGNEQFGSLTLKEALKHSVNTVFVQLIRDVGVKATMDEARRLGLESVPEYDASKYGVSVALGALDTSPLQLASAYGVWAARGERAEPTPIVRILDSQDVVLEDNAKPKQTRVEREVTADTMNEILQGPLSTGGTAGGKGLKDRPSAGKTGTTQDNKDALFVGYTPNLSTAVWLGYRNHAAPLHNIKGVRNVTGGTIPASTWNRFMTRAHKNLDVVKFKEPAPITDVANDAKKKAHGGYEVGRRFVPRGTDEGSGQSEELPPPSVEPPPEETTSTTSTTLLFGGTGGNGNGNGNGRRGPSP